MKKTLKFKFEFFSPRLLGAFTILACINVGNAFSQAIPTLNGESSAAVLLEKYVMLQPQLMQNIYHRPLVFESAENSGAVTSDVYAILDSPFNVVSTTFKKPDLWCEVLILHLNTKYCQASPKSVKPERLVVNVGKKTPQPLSDTFRLEFSYRIVTDMLKYLAVELHANKGPLNTTDYQLQLRATPLAEGKTFINLRYSYRYGLVGKVAMETYLSTLGRGKVGFTKMVLDEKVVYIEGMRGAVERNTMRYYLAIEAYLKSLKHSSSQPLEARLQYWFDATEEYALQLHEVDRQSYLVMKKGEYQRQKTTLLAFP